MTAFRSLSLATLFFTLGLSGCSAETGASPESAVADSEKSAQTEGTVVLARSLGATASTTNAVQEVRIMDTGLSAQPMLAAQAEIPAGWQTQGGIRWDRNSSCVGNFMRMEWLAASPDGRQAYEIMPGYSWQLQGTEIPMNPCPPLPVRSTREFLEMIVRQRYPDARVVEYRDRKDLVPPSAQSSTGASQRSEAGQLLIVYRRGNDEIRESLMTTLNVSQLNGNVVLGVANVHAQRTADGELDFALGERIMRSLKADPQWMNAMSRYSQQAIQEFAQRQSNQIASWHNAEMARINAQGARDRSAIAMQTNREVAQIYSNTWAQTQATNDRMHRRNLEAIGEYNTYRDPVSGSRVQSTIHDDYVWRLGDGSYVSTKDPNFNPSNGVQLERIP